MITSSSSTASIPDRCDYLVVGGGATGMAFVDSLLKGTTTTLLPPQDDETNNDSDAVTTARMMSIVMVDQHNSPGGQWHDSYDFVRLHQPSACYGVESMALEPSNNKEHLATRREILEYYSALQTQWESSKQFHFKFVGNATVHFAQDSNDNNDNNNNNNNNETYSITVSETTQNDDGSVATTTTSHTHTIHVKKRLVDARYLQPDLPVHVQPKFTYNANAIQCVPINELISTTTALASQPPPPSYYVVIGGGKTGMDAVHFLLTQAKVNANQIAWVVPHEPWITAREKIGTCIELLHTAVVAAKESSLLKDPRTMQQAFQKWHEQGKIYRLFGDNNEETTTKSNNNDDKCRWPTKFQDATLSKDELAMLRTIPSTNIIHGKGRVQHICDNGDLQMHNGGIVPLPWDITTTKTAVLFVHCSAGAFNYTKQMGAKPLPVFDGKRITIQDVYGTPGFCFVGSILGKLESLSAVLTDDRKNVMCQTPAPPPTTSGVGLLGPSGGDIVGLSSHHGWVQRLCNLRLWLQTPQLQQWLMGHRLFNMGHYSSVEEIEKMVDETYAVLKEAEIVAD